MSSIFVNLTLYGDFGSGKLEVESGKLEVDGGHILFVNFILRVLKK
jgi:hypothetical protein